MFNDLFMSDGEIMSRRLRLNDSINLLKGVEVEKFADGESKFVWNSNYRQKISSDFYI